MDFKNIIGEAKKGEIATIRFFGKITEDSVKQFNYEFDYLENCVRPSLIRVLINCEGGSVYHGMSSYSTIQNSTITTETIIEGIAASMGSVIWAAGNTSYMRDYSILMIHNPFLPNTEDEKYKDMIQAFTNQIQTIYRKRFGLKKDVIEKIMNGDEGKDGTYFDASSAVRAGIIPKENILTTSKQLCDKVKNEISPDKAIPEILSFMENIHKENFTLLQNNNPTEEFTPILSENQNTNMSEVKSITDYSAVAASLGLGDKYELKDIMSRISSLVGIEQKHKEVSAALTDAQTVIAGKDATIINLEKNLNEVKASLKVFEDKEKEALQLKIEACVNEAIEKGKIEANSKDKWVEMYNSNFELANGIINSIPEREQISKEIGQDPTNIQNGIENSKSVEEQMAKKVSEVVGQSFEFKKLED